MKGKSLDRWLLVNYAGYPFAPNSLFPDNGLANLAGVLREAGKTPLILDFATVSVLERLSSPHMQRSLAKTWDTLFPAAPEPGARSAPRAGRVAKTCALARLHRADVARSRLQARLLAELAEQLSERVQRDSIDAVGFKLWNGDGMEGSITLARELRHRCPGVKIFAGGPQVDTFMERIPQRYDVFDALVYGEGEETVRMLAEAGAEPSAYPGIPNLLFREGNTVRRTESRIVGDLDSLPAPVYTPDVYPAMEADEKIRILVIDESRGCSNSCAFCIHPVKSHRSLRVRSTEQLVRDVERMATECRTRTFRFAGSCTPYPVLNDFARAILDGKHRVLYSSFAHIRHSEEADFETMRASGCVSLFYGIESGSQAVLDRMRKGIQTDMIAPAVRRAREAGIFTVGSLIYPAPGDDETTEQETLALLAEAQPDALTVQTAVVVPGTDWYADPGRFGIVMRDRDAYADAAMRWKAKLLMPPPFWAPLPVAVNGVPFKQALKKTSAFIRRIEESGIPTSISDDVYLMSHRLGIDPVAFRDRARRAFFVGDAADVREMVAGINARLEAPDPVTR